MSDFTAITAPIAAPALIPPVKAAADPKLRAAAEDFEAMFITQMLEHMESGRGPDATFGGGNAEKTWHSVLNTEYGKSVAKRNGIGLADMLVRDMLKLQAGER
jgi:Rod binding domain-containing protein